MKVVHGSMLQSGFPDLFATHVNYGPRWIEVKLPDMKGSHFTGAQLREFPKFVKAGSPIWILTAATEMEYRKLFKPSNWLEYLMLKDV